MATTVPSAAELKQAYQVVAGEQIPSIPDVLSTLHEELAKREPDTRRISDLVARDQGIAGQVLKTVNSPMIGLRRSVDSISHAVVLLGIGPLRNLVSAMAFKSSLQVRSPAAVEIWEDSLNMAQLAGHIAFRVHDVSPDEAYLAALMHHCGALLLAEKFPHYGALLRLEDKDPTAAVKQEQRLLGTRHTVIGYLFAHHWQLPERVCQAIYLHHETQCNGVENPALRALVAILKLAYLLSREHHIANDAYSAERRQFFAQAQTELMLDDDFVNELRTELILSPA